MSEPLALVLPIPQASDAGRCLCANSDNVGVFMDRIPGPEGPPGPLAPKHVAFISSAGTNQTWTNMPAAQTELFGSAFARFRADLTGYAQFRLLAAQAVAGVAGALLRARYSLDGVSFLNLQETLTTGDLDAGVATGLKAGLWVSIAPAARTDVTLRLDGVGGNGTADPAWRQLALEIKP